MTPEELEIRRNKAQAARELIRMAQERQANAKEKMAPYQEVITQARADERAAGVALAEALCPFEVGDVVPLMNTYRGATHGKVVGIIPGYYHATYSLVVRPIKKNGELMNFDVPSYDMYLGEKLEKICGKTTVKEYRSSPPTAPAFGRGRDGAGDRHTQSRRSRIEGTKTAAHW